MKKQLLSLFAASSALTAFAQLPVSTAAENKKVVLEEFTGIHCGYCPDGHVKANAIYNADPDNVVLINIHSGSFANAAVGEPDFKTQAGTNIDVMPGMGITGYPAGAVNRRAFSSGSQTTNGMAGGRSSWAAWANVVKQEPAYCNVAVEGWIDTVSVMDPVNDVPARILTVKVEVYYTDNSPVASNSISVVLLEDYVKGPQSNYGNPYYNIANYDDPAHTIYNHNHVMRAMITPGFYGKKIATTSLGTKYTETFTYTIPQTYGAVGKETPCNIHNLKVAAYVTETYKNTINAANGPISFKTIETVGVKETVGAINDVALYPNPTNGVAKVRVNANKADNASVTVYNQVGQVVFVSSSKDLTVGVTSFDINTQDWSAGIYNVVVKGSEGSVAKKLNVVK